MDVLITNCLMAQDYELLDVFCHGSLSGDAAAVASKGIIKLLENQKHGGTVELFLKRIIGVRIRDYRNIF